jgi:hypothetical protein
VTWSRELLAADAVGVLTDADRIAVCGDREAPAHLRVTDSASANVSTDQLGRVTLLYLALGSLPSIRMGGAIRVCDRGVDGHAALPGEEYTVLDLTTRGPFHVAALSLPQMPASGADYR